MPLLLVAIGQTYVLIVRGIDLSVTAIVSMAAVVGASVMSSRGGLPRRARPLAVPAAMAAMAAGGARGSGAVNGLSVTRLNMPPFIVDAGDPHLLRGRGDLVRHLPLRRPRPSRGCLAAFTRLATVRRPGRAARRSSSWRAVAVGGPSRALALDASGSGCTPRASTPRRRGSRACRSSARSCAAFVVSGLCGAGAAAIYAARMQTGSPIAGANILLDVIGAVVIGGTSPLRRARAGSCGPCSACCSSMLLDTSMKLLGASLFLIFIIKGSVILAGGHRRHPAPPPGRPRMSAPRHRVVRA